MDRDRTSHFQRRGMANYSISVKDLTGNVRLQSLRQPPSIWMGITFPGGSVFCNATNSSYAKAGDNLTLTFNTSELIETPLVTLAGTNIDVQDTNMEQEPPGRQPTRSSMETTERLPSASSIRIRLEIRAHQSPQPRISLRSM